jgi:hypothetical protein
VCREYLPREIKRPGSETGISLASSAEVKNGLTYVGVLKSLWLLLFGAQLKEFFLDGLKKLEVLSVWSSGGTKYIFFQFHRLLFFYITKDLSAPFIPPFPHTSTCCDT